MLCNTYYHEDYRLNNELYVNENIIILILNLMIGN